jgi:O-antigen ligase
MITPTLFHFNEVLKKRRTIFVVLVITEILALILYANRGILLSLAFFAFYKFFIERRSNLIYSILFIILCVVVYVFQDVILLGLANFFSLFGLESRTLNMALNNNLSDSSGREEYWAICLQMIQEKPVFGWGLGGEFVTLGHRLSRFFGGNPNGFASAHNGIIQFFVELGVFGGVIATILFVKPIFRVNKESDSFVRDLIIIYFAGFGVTRLLSADGFYYLPQVAVYFYLYYFRRHCKLIS